MMGAGHSQYSHLVLSVERFRPATSVLFQLTPVSRRFPHVSVSAPPQGLYRKARRPPNLCAGQCNSGFRRRAGPVLEVANTRSVLRNELDQVQAVLCLIHAGGCPLRERLKVSEGMISSSLLVLSCSRRPSAGMSRSSSISASISWS